jgi:hypothetical protein
MSSTLHEADGLGSIVGGGRRDFNDEERLLPQRDQTCKYYRLSSNCTLSTWHRFVTYKRGSALHCQHLHVEHHAPDEVGARGGCLVRSLKVLHGRT